MTFRAKEHAALLWVALVGVVAGFPSLFYPFGKDQAIFAVVGHRWLAGGRPYEAAFDVKPPGIFAVYAVAEKVFGHSMASARILDLLAAIATAIGLCLLGRKVSLSIGLIAGIAYPLAYYGIFGFWQTAQAEGFAAPFVVWALYLAQRRSYGGAFAAGLLLGAAVLLKTTMVVFAVIGCLSLKWHIRQCASLALGVLVPAGLAIAYFGVRSMSELVSYQSSYASSPVEDFQSKLSKLNETLPAASGLMLGLMLAVALVGLGAARKGAGSDYAWLGIALASVVLQGRYYLYHFVVLLPPLSLVFARTLAALPKASRLTLAGASAALLLTVLPRYVLAGGLLTGRYSRLAYLGEFNYEDYSAADTARTADWISRHTAPDDTILVYSFDPGLYFLADRFACTRHISIATLWQASVPHELRQKWWDEIRSDVAKNRPKFLIFYRPAAERDWGGKRTQVQFSGMDYDLQQSNASFIVFAPAKPGLRTVSR